MQGVLRRGGSPGSPSPYFPTGHGDGPAAFPSVLWLWGRGTPHQPPSAPLGQPTGTTTQPQLNQRERQ